MWDKILVAVGTVGVLVAVSLVAYWAAKKWKSQYRDELRAWFRSHPNKQFKKIGLILVLAVDTAVTLGERIAVDIIGESGTGQVTNIHTKTLTVKEAEGLGLIKNNSVQNREAELFNESEILAIMNG